MQHTNVSPMTAEQRATFAKQLAALATPEAQAGTLDPVKAAEIVAWLAKQYAEG
jgi:hypothetical protein